MDLRQYLLPLRRWWWLIVATTLVATVSSWLALQQQPARYQARTSLIVGQVFSDPNPDSLNIYLVQSLQQTYVEAALREPVQAAAMETLGLTWLPEYTARAIPNTSLLEIVVTDTSPERAAAVAQALADQLIATSPTQAEQFSPERRLFIESQLSRLEVQIDETTTEIDEKSAELGELFSARQIADTQTQLTALNAKLATLQNTYAQLLANSTSGAVNTLSLFERARIPTQPIDDNALYTLLAAAGIGFLLAAGAAHLLEYLDDTLKGPAEVGQVLGLPTIGYVAAADEFSLEEGVAYMAQNPRTPLAEAFRTLRTNLEFAAVDHPLQTILITSPGPGEGKSTIAGNLGVAMAQGGKRVVVLDADMRRPMVHKLFDCDNGVGLSDLFRGHVTVAEAIRPTTIDNLRLITSGSAPPNPVELLASGRMQEILRDVGDHADVIIIDSPPFIVTDPYVLAAKVDGVGLVIRPGHTHAQAAKAAVDQLKRADARVIGAILNRIARRGSGYYGGYSYYSPYYYYRSDYYDASQPSRNGKNGNGSNGGWLKRRRKQATHT